MRDNDDFQAEVHDLTDATDGKPFEEPDYEPLLYRWRRRVHIAIGVLVTLFVLSGSYLAINVLVYTDRGPDWLGETFFTGRGGRMCEWPRATGADFSLDGTAQMRTSPSLTTR